MENDRIGFRINSEEKAMWCIYANKVGYDDLSKFIRDSINGMIEEGKKPSKVFIIENNKEV